MRIIFSVAFPACMLLLNCFGFAQDIEKANAYFSKFMSSTAVTSLIDKSLPTKEDCKLVFKGEDADIFFNYVQEQVANKLKSKMPVQNVAYISLGFETFTTADVLAKKGNYAGGMESIASKLQPGVIFYKLDMIRDAASKNGMAYKYWIKIKERWVFIPKPWQAFKTNPK